MKWFMNDQIHGHSWIIHGLLCEWFIKYDITFSDYRLCSQYGYKHETLWWIAITSLI